MEKKRTGSPVMDKNVHPLYLWLGRAPKRRDFVPYPSEKREADCEGSELATLPVVVANGLSGFFLLLAQFEFIDLLVCDFFQSRFQQDGQYLLKQCITGPAPAWIPRTAGNHNDHHAFLHTTPYRNPAESPLDFIFEGGIRSGILFRPAFADRGRWQAGNNPGNSRREVIGTTIEDAAHWNGGLGGELMIRAGSPLFKEQSQPPLTDGCHTIPSFYRRNKLGCVMCD